MTLGGWIFMLSSVGFVLWLLTWCFYKVLTHPGAAKHMHAPLDIDTHDQNT
ncbi:MAG: hypothetical protein HZA51_01610 [Planctomycetes bacterium]|nr:hypothetical protein [Planctomycetota bacterium]